LFINPSLCTPIHLNQFLKHSLFLLSFSLLLFLFEHIPFFLVTKPWFIPLPILFELLFQAENAMLFHVGEALAN